MPELTDKYGYSTSDPTWSNQYIWPSVEHRIRHRLKAGDRIMDLGCGNGATSNFLWELGYEVVGIDPSKAGIEIARQSFPQCKFEQRSAYDDLSSEFGVFDAVVSLEVVEHCYSPQSFASTVFSLLRPGGVALISTPFHGYWKNLALAIFGKFDEHWSPLWQGGHIKFWSEVTFSRLLSEAGFVETEIERIGRIPPLAKSMLAITNRGG